MIERTAMPVVLDNRYFFDAANKAFAKLGMTRTQYRPVRKRLRSDGVVMITIGDKEHILERSL